MPSHQMSPSSVRAQFVKTEHRRTVAIAFGLVFSLVPGATPKNPASGLIAWSRPSGPNFIHAMSSPTVSTFHPGSVGISIARFVLPHADGKAPATYFVSPSGEVSFRISMCSASQPSSRAIAEGVERALAHPGHQPHVHRDIGGVRELDADVGDRRAERPHREGNYVHRAPLHRPVEELAEDFLHLGGLPPGVGRAGVGLLLGADEGAVLDARDITGVG